MLRLFKQYYPIRNIFFVIGEGIVILASVFIGCGLILGWQAFLVDHHIWAKALMITVTCQVCLYFNELYDLTVTNTFSELGIRLLQALGVAAIVLAIIYFFFPAAIIARGIFVVSISVCIVLIVSWRFAYTFILERGFFNQRIFLLGSGELANNIYEGIGARKDCGYTVAGIIREDCQSDTILALNDCKGIVLQQGTDGLCALAKEMGIDKVVVAFKEKRGAMPTQELLKCRVDGIEVLEGTSFFEMLTGKLLVEHINPAWLIFSDGFQKSKLRRFTKRCFDLAMAFGLSLALFPVAVFVAVIIKLDSRGPVLFSQERVGEKRRAYQIHKFRSMVVDAEEKTGPMWAQTGDARITRVGRFIRKWRIDEIPQLFNVLRGDMSFVGPRPEREFFVQKLETIIPYFAERFSVKPGVTGWAQVSYGYGASVEDAIEKLNYDLFYIKNMSTFMDLMIVMRTVKTVLFGHGR